MDAVDTKHRDGRAPACPTCGHPAVPVLYGLPVSEAAQAAEEGRIVLGGCFPLDPNWACLGPERHAWRSGEDNDPQWRSAVGAALQQWGALGSDAEGREVWIGTRLPRDHGRAVAVTIAPGEGPDNEVLLTEESARELRAMLSDALAALDESPD
jgi:hypothetical protein